MDLTSWSLACSAIRDAQLRSTSNNQSDDINTSNSLPFFHLLSFIRESSVIYSNQLDKISPDQFCFTCRILNTFIEAIAAKPTDRMLCTFTDTMNSLYLDEGSLHLPRCCSTFTEEQCAAFVALYLRCWLSETTQLDLQVDFLSMEIDDIFEFIYKEVRETDLPFISSIFITLHELASFFVHKCPSYDPELVQKFISDISCFFLGDFLSHFLNISDRKLFSDWCNSKFSRLILLRNESGLLYRKKEFSKEVTVYDNVILRRCNWFWNNDITSAEGRITISKFPEGAFLAISEKNTFSCHDNVQASLLIKTHTDIEEYIVKRSLSGNISNWTLFGENPMSFNLLIDVVNAVLTVLLKENGSIDNAFAASKWIHDSCIFTTLPYHALERLMYETEVYQARLNQSLETAQAEFAEEQLRIQNAKNNDTLRGLTHLIAMYEEQRKRLADSLDEAEKAGPISDSSKFDQHLNILDSRLRSLIEKKSNVETELLKANSQQFNTLQTIMRSRLQAASLDAIKLRTVVSADVMTSGSSGAEIFGENGEDSLVPEEYSAPWMAPEGFNREEAEQLLTNSSDGSFIVRNRFASAWQAANDTRPFAISFRWNGATHHTLVFRIVSEEKIGFSLVGYQSMSEAERSGNLFPSLVALVNHYQSCSLPIENENSPGFGAKLTTPVSFR